MIIKIGKFIKRKIRYIQRSFIYGTKPIFVNVDTNNINFRILLDPYHNGCVDEIIYSTKLWEPKITEKISKILKEDGVFMDIGANIGYHSLYAAMLLKTSGQVHAFEPIPRLYQQILSSVHENKITNLKVYNYALGDTSEHKQINIRDENIGASSLTSFNNINAPAISSTEQIQVKKLDSILPSDTKVKLVKIDVEGYEYEALKGAEKILRAQHPDIIIEFSPQYYEADYTNKTIDFIKFLENLGYEFYSLDNNRINLLELFEQDKIESQIELICVNKHHL